MKEIKVLSGIVYLIDFSVVREKVPPFPCYRKENYIMKYPELIDQLFPNSQFFLKGVLSIYWNFPFSLYLNSFPIKHGYTYVSMYTRTQQELTDTQNRTTMYGITVYISVFFDQ